MTSQDRWARIQVRIVRLVWADGLYQGDLVGREATLRRLGGGPG
jgi:hypothetical protein